jgi:hypothetical protein
MATTCGGIGPGADLLDFLPSSSSSSSSSYNSDSTDSSSDQSAGDPPSSVDSPAASAAAAAAAEAAESEAAACRAQQAYISISTRFDSWVQHLHPSRDEKRRLKAVLDLVQQALASKAVSKVWSVMAMHPVGSFPKNTSLRNS